MSIVTAVRQSTIDVTVESKAGAVLALRRIHEQAVAAVLQGRRYRITGVEAYDDLTVRQRRFMHGPVLGQIAERAMGGRYEVKVWKEHFREKFLGSEWREEIDPESGEVRVVEHRISSESLDVAQYSDWIDRVIAYAATELDVVFTFREGEREAARKRKRTPLRRQTLGGALVDSEPYRRYVASLPCIHCGIEGISQAAHANYGKGEGIKTDDRMCFPLCADTVGRNGCHPALDQGALFPRDARRDYEWQWALMTRERIAADGRAPLAVRLVAGFGAEETTAQALQE